MQEYALQLHEQDDLYPIFNTMLSENSYQILVLSKHAKALVIKELDVVLGAQGSCHCRSSLILAKHAPSGDIGLAEIAFFS